MTTIEEWRLVPNQEYLEASSLGRVRSVPYETPMPRGGSKINQLNPTYGHIQIMSKNYSRKALVFRRQNYRIATLVAEAFLGPKPEGCVLSHKDENSFNNTPNNLEYITQKENLNKPKFIEYCKNRRNRDVRKRA